MTLFDTSPYFQGFPQKTVKSFWNDIWNDVKNAEKIDLFVLIGMKIACDY